MDELTLVVTTMINTFQTLQSLVEKTIASNASNSALLQSTLNQIKEQQEAYARHREEDLKAWSALESQLKDQNDQMAQLRSLVSTCIPVPPARPSSSSASSTAGQKQDKEQSPSTLLHQHKSSKCLRLRTACS